MTHTSTEQPEPLMKLADDYAKACFDQALHLRIIDDKPEAARKKLEKELRRLRAHVQELEAQLEAVGAGGVQPLRKTVAASACSGCGSCKKFTGDSEMRRAFEIEYGQNWTDPDWRREAAIWASAWHKATAAAQQGVRQAYVLEDDGHKTYLDGCESRFSIRRADGECVAWVAPLDKDSGEAVAREMIAALNATHPTPQGHSITDALEALQEAEAALEVACARLEKQRADYPVGATSEGKALMLVRKVLAAQAKQGGA